MSDDAYDLLTSLEEGRIRAALLQMKIDLMAMTNAIGSLDNRMRQRLLSRMFAWSDEDKAAWEAETGESCQEAGIKRFKIFEKYVEEIVPFLDILAQQVY